MSEHIDLLDNLLFNSIDAMPGEWEPLVTGPEDWLIASEEDEDEDIWESMALAFESHSVTTVKDEQAELSHLLSLFA